MLRSFIPRTVFLIFLRNTKHKTTMNQVADKIHAGRGTMKYASGDVYEGELKDGDNRHGRGMYRYANGNVYEGEWKDDRRHGRGTNRFADGDVYEGEFKDGNIHGRGTMRYANGTVYEGEWRDGQQYKSGQDSEEPRNTRVRGFFQRLSSSGRRSSPSQAEVPVGCCVCS
jgi:hypothetical protein